jgi:Putative zinc-finger
VTRHVDAEALARYREEDLSARRASRIRAHLAGCARCRALDEDLAGVTTLLAEAGAVGWVETVQPPPIPEHLAARIQTALAAEAARREALPAAAASTAPWAAAEGEAPQARAEPAVTGGPDRRTQRQGRHGRDRMRQRRPGFTSPVALRTMAAAAAVVVLAGGGYEIAQHVGGSSPSSSSAAAPPARQPVRGNHSAPSAGQALRLPSYLQVGHQEVPVIESGTDYTPATLKDQVKTTVTTFGPLTRPGPSARALGPSSSQASGSASRLMGCVTRIAAGRQVLLVDEAHYRNTPATVIVTGASAGGPEQVWVAGQGCSAASSDLLAHATLSPAG